jgi:hypothetical protein
MNAINGTHTQFRAFPEGQTGTPSNIEVKTSDLFSGMMPHLQALRIWMYH